MFFLDKCLPSISWYHGGGSGISGQNQFRSRQISFFKFQRTPPALIQSSDAGPAGHLGYLRGHELRSFTPFFLHPSPFGVFLAQPPRRYLFRVLTFVS
jgi:hypothetical protein